MGIFRKRQGLKKVQSGAFVITGSGSGIGAATALWLNERDFWIFAGVRKAEQGQALKAKAACADRLMPILLDVTDAAAITAAARTVQATLAAVEVPLKGLVNNAANENLGPVEVLPLEIFRHEMEVGYLGTVAVTKAFLPLLREYQGRVVNLSSINGRCTFKYHATTCATKYAVEAFSDALRMELKRWGMHVAIIEPGPTDTPLMVEKTIEEFTCKLAQYPAEVRDLYFPDYAATLNNVVAFVHKMQSPPYNRWDKLQRLCNGQGWLHAPVDVAKTIEHALTSATPKTRYMVGIQARLIWWMRCVLSDAQFDRLLAENVFEF